MNHSKLRKTTNTKNKWKTNSRSYFDPIKDLFSLYRICQFFYFNIYSNWLISNWNEFYQICISISNDTHSFRWVSSWYIHANKNKESKFDNYICVPIIHKVKSRKLRRHFIINLIKKKQSLHLAMTHHHKWQFSGEMLPYSSVRLYILLALSNQETILNVSWKQVEIIVYVH